MCVYSTMTFYMSKDQGNFVFSVHFNVHPFNINVSVHPFNININLTALTLSDENEKTSVEIYSFIEIYIVLLLNLMHSN